MRSPAARTLLVQLTAGWAAYAALAFGVALMNLMSLDLYKPYGLTHTRRFLYERIYVGRDALSYAGTAGSLARLTFYPALAVLTLLLLPGLIQLQSGWRGALWIGGGQLLLLLGAQQYLDLRARHYELSMISWRGLPFSASPVPQRAALGTSLLGVLNLLTLGALAPWRRVHLARQLYAALFWGRHRISFAPVLPRVWWAYYAGWLLALAGWLALALYGWRSGASSMLALYHGAPPDSALVPAPDPVLLGMTGGAGGATAGQLAGLDTALNLLTLSFVIIPAGMIWQQLCLSVYEHCWWRSFFAGLQLGTSGLRYEGTVLGLGAVRLLGITADLLTANLSRPFTSYLRIRYFCRHLVVTTPESLDLLLRPPAVVSGIS